MFFFQYKDKAILLPPWCGLPLLLALIPAVVTVFSDNPIFDWLIAASFGLSIFISSLFVLFHAHKLIPRKAAIVIGIGAIIGLNLFSFSLIAVIDILFDLELVAYISKWPIVRFIKPWYSRYDTIMTFIDWIVMIGGSFLYILTFGMSKGEGPVNDPVQGPGWSCGFGCLTVIYIIWMIAAGRFKSFFQPLRDIKDLLF